MQPDGGKLCSDFLPLATETIAEKLSSVGYATHFVGKGHLGYQTTDHLPVARGFDTHVGYLAGMENSEHGLAALCDTKTRYEQAVYENELLVIKLAQARLRKELFEQKEAELRGRGLRPVNAILIASDLRVSAVLTTLDLHLNIIGPSGASAIAEALKVNAVLTKLDLRDNRLDNAAKQSLRDVVSGRSGFELLL